LLNLPNAGGKKIQKYWNETFTSDGGGDIEGLALGIAGDSVRFLPHFCREIILSTRLSQCLLIFCLYILLGSQPALATTAWRTTTHTQAECLVALDWYQRLGSRWLLRRGNRIGDSPGSRGDPLQPPGCGNCDPGYSTSLQSSRRQLITTCKLPTFPLWYGQQSHHSRPSTKEILVVAFDSKHQQAVGTILRET
jgi:hypothetical protein